MSFVKRELESVKAAMRTTPEPDKWCQLYAVQQSLAWALEPDGFASPTDTVLNDRVIPITGTQANSEDCLAHCHQPQS